MPREPKNVRLPIMVTPSEAKAIDDWRFSNRIGSRAEAMRRLLALGILASDLRDAIEEVMNNYDRVICYVEDGDPEHHLFADLIGKIGALKERVDQATSGPLDTPPSDT